MDSRRDPGRLDFSGLGNLARWRTHRLRHCGVRGRGDSGLDNSLAEEGLINAGSRLTLFRKISSHNEEPWTGWRVTMHHRAFRASTERACTSNLIWRDMVLGAT